MSNGDFQTGGDQPASAPNTQGGDAQPGARTRLMGETVGFERGTLGRAFHNAAATMHTIAGDAGDGSRSPGGEDIEKFATKNPGHLGESVLSWEGYQRAREEKAYWKQAAKAEPDYNLNWATEKFAGAIPTPLRFGLQAGMSLLPEMGVKPDRKDEGRQ